MMMMMMISRENKAGRHVRELLVWLRVPPKNASVFFGTSESAAENVKYLATTIENAG